MIIAAQPSNKGAVGFYRLIQPLNKVHHDPKHEDHAAIKHFNINQAQWDLMVPQFNVFIWQYPQTEAEAKLIEYVSTDPKTLTVIEIDDLVWNMDARQERYKLFGTREVKVEGKWLYKDGENGFDLKGNIKRMKNLVRCLMAADLITVTTPELKEMMVKNLKEAGKKKIWVEVLPNCVDLEYYDPVEIVKDKIRIIWQGGDGHRHDLWEISDALKEVLDKHPEVEMVFAAHSWPEITKKLGKDRVVTNHAWTSFDAFPYRLKLLGGDIGICPLVDTEFNHAKSEIKFTEYASLGMPVVASDCVYGNVIEDGKTGFVAKNHKEWVQKLSKLIEDEKLRKKMGASARKWVEQNRSADKTFRQWPDAYQKYLDIKT